MLPIRRKIALVMENTSGYGRGVMRGVRNYAKRRRSWRFHIFGNRERCLDDLAELNPHGIVAHIGDQAFCDELLALGKPVVNVSHVAKDLNVPRVGADDVAVGEQAAGHLLERAFRNFAFIGFEEHEYSRLREFGFQRTLKSAGYQAASFLHGVDRGTEFSEWLTALPKPVGIFASTDNRAWSLSETCEEIALRVPEDVAIVGADNDEFLCEMAYPTLSSVRMPKEQIGYEAAAILDAIMAGQPAPAQPTVFPPLGVATRQSSDLLAMNDKEVAEALRFIHRNAGAPITVEDILQQVSVSRRSLERRFQLVLKRTPLDEIRRVHLERAKDLLIETEMSIAEVAEKAGFQGAEYFTTLFKKETGSTPREFRRQHRLPSASA